MEEEEKLRQEIYHKMALLCSKSEQCSADIIRKVKDQGGDDIMAKEIVSQLEKENYLNDQRFVKLYIHEKFRVNKWGRVKMQYYLKMKGVKEEVIRSGFEEIDENEYVTLLIQTMKEKARSVKSSNPYERMGQIIRFAQNRGFEPELIHRHLREVQK